MFSSTKLCYVYCYSLTEVVTTPSGAEEEQEIHAEESQKL